MIVVKNYTSVPVETYLFSACPFKMTDFSGEDKIRLDKRTIANKVAAFFKSGCKQTLFTRLVYNYLVKSYKFPFNFNDDKHFYYHYFGANNAFALQEFFNIIQKDFFVKTQPYKSYLDTLYPEINFLVGNWIVKYRVEILRSLIAQNRAALEAKQNERNRNSVTTART